MDAAAREKKLMENAAQTPGTGNRPRGPFPAGLSRGFVTIVASTVALIVACYLFAPSSISSGALSGSLPFAAVLAIVGLGQMLVVQQGGFDLSVAGAVSLAVVISTHVPHGNNAELLPAVLMAVGFALAAGVLNGVLVGVVRLNAIIATIGTNALLYGAVFAVSGGVPNITTTLLGHIAGGETFGIANSLYFALAALLVVAFVMKKTVGGRRFEAIGANPAMARTVGLSLRLPDSRLHLRAAALLPRRRTACRHHARTDGLPGRPAAAAVGRRRGARRHLASRRTRLSGLDGGGGVLP